MSCKGTQGKSSGRHRCASRGEVVPSISKPPKHKRSCARDGKTCTLRPRGTEEEDGVRTEKGSLSVPVLASFMIISGEEEGDTSGGSGCVGSLRTQQEGCRDGALGTRGVGAEAAMSHGSCPSDPQAVVPQRYKEEHEESMHVENMVDEPRSTRSEKNYQCKVCARHFDTASRLRSHKAANACHAPYACRLCSREFHGANELAEHAESAHADPRMCVLCGRLLSRKDKLENHVRTHTGEQPFECKFCLKRFSRRDRFNEHEKLHRGTSFRCGECQKSFSRRDKMKEHFQRSHHDRTVDWYAGGDSGLR